MGIRVFIAFLTAFFCLSLGACDDSDLSPEEAHFNPKDYIYPAKVPSGEPGDPFLIHEYRGDGWTLLDSGPGLLSEGTAWWVDDKRVVFGAHNSGHFKTIEDRRASANTTSGGLHIWDLAENSIHRLKGIGQTTSFCITPERSLIAVKDWKGKGPRWIAGPFGEEEETSLPLPYSRDMYLNKMDCDLVPKRPSVKGVWFQELRNGDGYLEYSDKAPWVGGPIFYVREDGQRTIMPFRDNQVVPTCTRYIRYRNAYFVWDCLANSGLDEYIKLEEWRQSNCLKAWWLFPQTGRAEEICIPFHEAFTNASLGVIPYRGGLFAFSHNHGGRWASNRAGAYIVLDNKWVQLFSGHVDFGGGGNLLQLPSPDGCKLAFSYAPSIGASSPVGRGPRTFRILNLCAENKI